MATVPQTNDALRAASTSMLNAVRQRRTGSDDLGKQDFLNLLMTQVTHQDPLDPMDSKGMIEQLTQMGALEQMINMNGNIEKLGKAQTDLMRTNAYTFLDKDVKVKGGDVRVRQGSVSPLQYELPRGAREVDVRIQDAQGNPVRTLEQGAQQPGTHSVKWDGLDRNGKPVADGHYPYRVVAKDENAREVPVSRYTWGKVSGVQFRDGRPTLTVNGSSVDVRDVLEVRNRSQRLYSNSAPYPPREHMRARPPVTGPDRSNAR